MIPIPNIPRIDPATPEGTLVWWCHHAVPLEALWEMAGERSAYIDAEKPAHERAVRHACFQVVKDQVCGHALLAAYQQAEADAWAAYQEATADARAAYQEATADAGAAFARATADAWAAFAQATAPALAAYRQAMGEAARPLVAMFREEYPELAHLVTDTGALVFPT